MYPGDQVVKQEEDQNQPHGHVAEDAAVVPPRAHHGGKALHAAGQQPRRTQEVGVLKEEGGSAEGHRGPRDEPHHAVQILVLIIRFSVDIKRQLSHDTKTRVSRVRLYTHVFCFMTRLEEQSHNSQISVWTLWRPGYLPDVGSLRPACRPQSFLRGREPGRVMKRSRSSS